MPLLLRVLVTAFAAFAGVSAAYLVADGRGWLPWVMIFGVGLGVGLATRGGWLAGMAGVIAAHVLVGYVGASIQQDFGRDAIDFAGDGLLLGVVLFTPAYLFGAASRLRNTAAAGPVTTDAAGPAADRPSSLLSPRAMVGVGCAILGAFGLMLGYIAWQFSRGGY